MAEATAEHEVIVEEDKTVTVEREPEAAIQARNQELFAEAFDNSDLDDRHMDSIYRGSDEITSKNVHRHVIKQNVLQDMKAAGELKQTAVKVMLANGFTSFVQKTVADNLSQPLVNKQLSQTARLADSPRKSPLSRSSTMPKAQLEALVRDEKRKRSPRRKSDSKFNKSATPRLLEDLRAIYDRKADRDLVEMEDEHLYTDIALLQRESIRFDPELHVVLGELYAAVDANMDGSINEEEYTVLIKLLYHCLRGFWDSSMPEKTEAELAAVARKDWLIDSKGEDNINYDRFTVAIFKLCDVWTDYISKQSYIDFLVNLRNRLTCRVLRKGRGIGIGATKRRLRTFDEIQAATQSNMLSSDGDKVATILQMYDKTKGRWEMNELLAFWLSRGSNPDALLNKDSEVSSRLIIGFLQRYQQKFQRSWMPTVRHCQAALRNFESEQRKQKEKALAKPAQFGVTSARKEKAKAAVEDLASSTTVHVQHALSVLRDAIKTSQLRGTNQHTMLKAAEIHSRFTSHARTDGKGRHAQSEIMATTTDTTNADVQAAFNMSRQHWLGTSKLNPDRDQYSETHAKEIASVEQRKAFQKLFRQQRRRLSSLQKAEQGDYSGSGMIGGGSALREMMKEAVRVTKTINAISKLKPKKQWKASPAVKPKLNRLKTQVKMKAKHRQDTAEDGKYAIMLKSGLPEVVVRQRMLSDGLPVEQMHAFFDDAEEVVEASESVVDSMTEAIQFGAGSIRTLPNSNDSKSVNTSKTTSQLGAESIQASSDGRDSIGRSTVSEGMEASSMLDHGAQNTDYSRNGVSPPESQPSVAFATDRGGLYGQIGGRFHSGVESQSTPPSTQRRNHTDKSTLQKNSTGQKDHKPEQPDSRQESIPMDSSRVAEVEEPHGVAISAQDRAAIEDGVQEEQSAVAEDEVQEERIETVDDGSSPLIARPVTPAATPPAPVPKPMPVVKPTHENMGNRRQRHLDNPDMLKAFSRLIVSQHGQPGVNNNQSPERPSTAPAGKPTAAPTPPTAHYRHYDQRELKPYVHRLIAKRPSLL